MQNVKDELNKLNIDELNELLVQLTPYIKLGSKQMPFWYELYKYVDNLIDIKAIQEG